MGNLNLCALLKITPQKHLKTASVWLENEQV